MSSEYMTYSKIDQESRRALMSWRQRLVGAGVSLSLTVLTGCLDDPTVDELPPYAEEYSEDGGMYRPVEPSSGSGYGSGYGSGSGAQPAASGAQPAASGAQKEDDRAEERFEERFEESEAENEDKSKERALNSRDRARFIESWSRGELSTRELEALGVIFERDDALEAELDTAELQRSRGRR